MYEVRLMAPTTIGIDIGTTSVKAVVVDDGGHILDRVRVPHPVLVPAPNRFEHDANRAWRAAKPSPVWRRTTLAPLPCRRWSPR